jgi:peptidoglycan-associated lipoprotein
MQSSYRWCAVVILAGLTVVACGKKPPQTAPPPPAPPAATPAATTPAPPPPPPPAPTPAATPRPPTEEELFAKATVDELNARKPFGDPLFAYDSTDLTEAARGILQKNADWMKRWSSTKVVVEGHADSRGTNEYNLALGERRADVVRDYMVGLGIVADRLTIVSKGEEQPVCKEETEDCWQQNRRGHLVVMSK